MDLRGSLRGFGFVDCGIVWRSSLVRRVIGRIYSASWGDIVLDSKRSVSGALCIGSGGNHNCEDWGHMDLGRKEGLWVEPEYRWCL